VATDVKDTVVYGNTVYTGSYAAGGGGGVIIVGDD
jgi:hypothetical protein